MLREFHELYMYAFFTENLFNMKVLNILKYKIFDVYKVCITNTTCVALNIIYYIHINIYFYDNFEMQFCLILYCFIRIINLSSNCNIFEEL